ncbi:MAG: DNA primase [Planctomycetes bacterium]|nr:DNA primase [Planctomycetota bacterium]
MAAGDRAIVEQVKGAVDIVDVATQLLRVPLTKKGERFVALCPFHREKTPSFSVNPSLQIFKCFGCGKGGDVLTLVMELERLTFPEALAHLAAKAGIALPEHGDGAKVSARQRRLAILAESAAIYADWLAQPMGAAAREYLTQRAFGETTIKAFGMGFAPDARLALYQVLKKRGHADEDIFATGVVRQKDAATTYDLLRHRVVIPIRDLRGQVIGFGGRVLGDGEPKYLNSPETELFSKRTVLFGLDRAAEAASKRGAFVIVEGYMDVIAAHQHGVDHVVGTLGTALTPEHVRILQRYANKVVLLFDGDAAGQRAADRGAALLLQTGMHVTVVTLRDGLDPDEFLAQHGADAFEAFLAEHAEELLDYLVRRARERHAAADPVSGTVNAIRELVANLEGVEDRLVRDVVLDRIASAFGVPVANVRAESAKLRRVDVATQATTLPSDARAPSRRINGAELDEIWVVLGAVSNPQFAEQAFSALSIDDLRDVGRRQLFERLVELWRAGHALSFASIENAVAADAEARGALDAILRHDIPDGESASAALQRVVGRRADHEYRRRRTELAQNGTFRTGEEDDVDRHLREIMEFQRRRVSRGPKNSETNTTLSEGEASN